MGTEKIESVKHEKITATPYDDVFRTLLNDCEQLIIPMINEIFGKNYTGKEKIVFHPNEHFINQQDGVEQKRITDSSFSIISEDGTEDKYILECQSTADDTMLVRIFEYITQEALDSGKIEKHQLIVTIPNAAVLFLRTKKDTPDVMNIIINTPSGSVNFDVPAMKVKKYSLEKIFEKNLFFLLPFYLFNLEKNFEKYENKNSELEKLKSKYSDFMKMLAKALNDGKISAYDHGTILDMSKKVLENLAAKYKNVQKGVKDIMGGQILEYKTKTIFKNGFAAGEEHGEARGRSETLNAAIEFMRSNGMSIEKINDFKNSVLKN